MIETSKRCPYCGAELDIGGQWYACGLWPLTCEQRRTYTCLRNELTQIRTRADKLERCLAFFASVIKCGEPWSKTCEIEYRKATAS